MNKIEKKVDQSDKKTQIAESMTKLYKDWLKTRSKKQIAEVREILSESSKTGLRFVDFLREMKADGQKMNDLYSPNWTMFGDETMKAKKSISKMLLQMTPRSNQKESESGTVETNMGLSYYPIADRSNSMESFVDPNLREITIQIRHAIVGKNFAIAEQLIKSSWNKMSLNEKNSLVEWLNGFGAYGAEAPDVVQGKKLKMKPLESKTEMTKDEFAEKFCRTAEEFMKV